jgi:GH43 family beta-xylosidase
VGHSGQQVNLASSFDNPVLPSGPDPWVLTHDGFYYYTNTSGANLTIWKTRDISRLQSAYRKVVWTPPPGKPYSSDLWAPELHFLSGKWYIYFAAGDGRNESHASGSLKIQLPILWKAPG